MYTKRCQFKIKKEKKKFPKLTVKVNLPKFFIRIIISLVKNGKYKELKRAFRESARFFGKF